MTCVDDGMWKLSREHGGIIFAVSSPDAFGEAISETDHVFSPRLEVAKISERVTPAGRKEETGDKED